MVLYVEYLIQVCLEAPGSPVANWPVKYWYSYWHVNSQYWYWYWYSHVKYW